MKTKNKIIRNNIRKGGVKLRKGLVQIYTGNGKGKTTAALGLSLRAEGAGLRVYILQFIKGHQYSEIKALKRIKKINVEQCGSGCFLKKKPGRVDLKCVKDGLVKARKNIASGSYDLVILDEAIIALRLGLITLRQITDIIKHKPSCVELVLTGRYCPPELFPYADLVTEMREIKHPYELGMKARKGIEC